MKAAVIAIGDELLLGQVTDTNSGSIARIISPAGWSLASVQVVGDNADEIRTAIDRAFEAAPVVLTTGGLGPTRDDITKALLADIFGGPMRVDTEVLDNVRAQMTRRGLAMNDSTASQAVVPASCTVIQNRCGTAPLMWFDSPRGVLVAMPGVPSETVTMFESEVFPRLRRRWPDKECRGHRSYIVSGISESALNERLEPWETALPGFMHLAYLPNGGYIRLRLDSRGTDTEALKAATDSAEKGLLELLGDNLVACGDKTPAEILLELADSRGIKLATAESCTGGNIAAALTAIPGSSSCTSGGVVAYSNSVKTAILGVDPQTIARLGAVSEEVARQMALGACRATGADLAMATSGIAGPSGGTPEKPVGTVCVAVALRGNAVSRTVHLPGNRKRVIERAVNSALLMAIDILKQ